LLVILNCKEENANKVCDAVEESGSSEGHPVREHHFFIAKDARDDFLMLS